MYVCTRTHIGCQMEGGGLLWSCRGWTEWCFGFQSAHALEAMLKQHGGLSVLVNKRFVTVAPDTFF